MVNPFTKHPHQVNESYSEHLGFALRFGVKMTLGGLAAIAHALIPFLFVTTAGRVNDELQAMRKHSPGRKKAILGGGNMPQPPSAGPESRK